MPRSLWFFYILLFFILGVGLNSYFKNFIILAGFFSITSLILVFLGYQTKKARLFSFALLLLASIIGAGYYQIYANSIHKIPNLIFERKIIFEAKVVSDPEINLNSQKMTLNLKSPYQGNILLTATRFPAYSYGDVLEVQGIIKQPKGNYAEYLAKNRIFGTIDFPKIEIAAKNQGSILKTTLFKIKDTLENGLKKSLNFKQAAFLNGLIFGDRSEFSKNFEKNLSLTGTTHLVALSGYNISIIILAIAGGLGFLGIKRRLIFWITVFFILSFVLMTGAQASIIRAAIMGGLLMMAGYAGKIYNFRNAIILAAFLMVLFNPLVLRYDVGFQLSFMSLLGIVYLKPALMKLFKINAAAPSFLNWRDNAFNTMGAQLMVAPLLLINFGSLSSVGLFTNILILGTVPLAMLLGFLTGVFGIILPILGIITGWLTYPLIAFQLGIIDLFAQVGSPLAVKNFSWLAVLMYYILAIIFIKIYAFRK